MRGMSKIQRRCFKSATISLPQNADTWLLQLIRVKGPFLWGFDKLFHLPSPELLQGSSQNV